MSSGSDIARELQHSVAQAAADGAPLNLTSGNSKTFFGRESRGQPFDVSAHCGIVNYEPKELVVTARAGTTLQQLTSVLAAQRQMLAFEPPWFGDSATLGGTIACGLSGPRRPYAGAARDFVLGTRLINGQGDILHFGGEVMKNVAGYDVSRLMTGALGTLGLLLEISLKVLPQPEREITLVREATAAAAIQQMCDWAAQPMPLSAACHDGLHLYLRLSGTPKAVAAGSARIGGEELAAGNSFWASIREQTHAFFSSDTPLWRLSLPAFTPARELPGKQLIDWGGAQRWLASDTPAEEIRHYAAEAGGHATLFRHGDRSGAVFTTLSSPLSGLHQRLKAAFDPVGIFNPGRLYPEF